MPANSRWTKTTDRVLHSKMRSDSHGSSSAQAIRPLHPVISKRHGLPKPPFVKSGKISHLRRFTETGWGRRPVEPALDGIEKAPVASADILAQGPVSREFGVVLGMQGPHRRPNEIHVVHDRRTFLDRPTDGHDRSNRFDGRQSLLNSYLQNSLSLNLVRAMA